MSCLIWIYAVRKSLLLSPVAVKEIITMGVCVIVTFLGYRHIYLVAKRSVSGKIIQLTAF